MNSFFLPKVLLLLTVFGVCFCNPAMSQWEKLETLHGEYIKSLASTGDALFAAGDYLYSSGDFGRTWSRLQTLPETPPRVLFGYPGYLFAGTFRHLYRSVNNGMNWTDLMLPDSVFSVTAFCRVQGALIVNVATGTGDKIFLSEDNGDSWQSPETPVPTAVIRGLFEINGSVYACTYAGICRSFDRGHHWDVFTPLIETSRWDYNFLAYANQRFIVVTQWACLTSPDGVAWDTMSVLYNKPQCGMVLDSLGNSGQRILMGTAGYNYGSNFHGLFCSGNNGIDWLPVPDINTRNAEVTCILKCDSGIYAGTTSDGVLRSSDNGVTWQVANSGMSERLIHKITADEHFLVVSDGNKEDAIFVSADHGASWQYHGLNLVSSYLRVNDIMVQDDRLWVATWKGLFTKKITDTVWDVHQPDSIFRFLAKSGQTVWAATDFALFKTANSGQTWTDCPWTAGLHGYAQGLSANNQAVVMMAEGFMTYSTDGGEHFSTTSFPGSEHYIRILDNDGTDFYVFSTGKGVYRSGTNGADWALVNDTAIHELSDVTANASCIFTANSIFGVKRSTDKGQSWNSYNEGFLENTWEARGVALSGDTLYLTGYYKWSPGVGIWKRSAFPAGIPAQETHDERLQIRPNPASDRIFVTVRLDFCAGVPYTIFDIGGQVVMSGITGADGSIRAGDLCPGLFLVVIRLKSKQYTGQFVRE